ncbi:hypothetical protein A0H81_14723 [Grifola frondosa]|uniref:Uncharacterized protein n=1 Tax=Grifola frondosa TaxID=5627 RepID=A0A1C7LL14_GRIFR|nr:hypothetical protein A0H81_14723 [Grifola frondosa]
MLPPSRGIPQPAIAHHVKVPLADPYIFFVIIVISTKRANNSIAQTASHAFPVQHHPAPIPSLSFLPDLSPNSFSSASDAMPPRAIQALRSLVLHFSCYGCAVVPPPPPPPPCSQRARSHTLVPPTSPPHASVSIDPYEEFCSLMAGDDTRLSRRHADHVFLVPFAIVHPYRDVK